MPFTATWIDLEIVIPSEVKSDREAETLYNIPYMQNLKRNRLRDLENELMVPRGEHSREGKAREFGMYRCTDCYILDG